MSKQIFYIHGLGGGVKSATYIGLCSHFDNVEILEYPSETATFTDNFKLISRKFFSAYKGGKFLLVGTSLGGFYASKLVEEIVARNVPIENICVIMINPAVNPYAVALGLNYPQALIDSYNGIEISTLPNIEKRIVLALDDELLDARQTARIFSTNYVLSFAKGGHSCWATLENDIVSLIRSFT